MRRKFIKGTQKQREKPKREYISASVWYHRYGARTTSINNHYLQNLIPLNFCPSCELV